MRKTFTLFLLLFAVATTQAQLKISQVYGAGGTVGATYKNDFIEIFNPTGASVSLTNWSIQYAATGGATWTITPLAGSIGAGKYFLIAMAGGSFGANLPTADLTGATNMSTNAGKVALVNSTSAVVGSCPVGGATVIDFVGYGTGTNCYEGASGPTPTTTTTAAAFRANNGCIDNNNNAIDFYLAVPNPRNSASAANLCTSPYILAAQDITGLVGSTNAPSNVSSYTLKGYNLSPAAGNLTVTAGANIQVATAVGGPFSSSLNVPYTGGNLAAITIYVRIASGVTGGIFSGTITNSGGAAANAIINVSGIVYKNYFNTKPGGNGLNDTLTWSLKLDGTGSSPVDFAGDYQVFNIVSSANAWYTDSWDVTSSNGSSKVVVGDGTNFMVFTVLSDADSVSSRTKIDVMNNATLSLENAIKPTFGTLATGSTIEFAQFSTDTIRIPAGTYWNLSLTNGMKYFSPGTTTVLKDLVVNAAVVNGSKSLATVIVNGDVIFAGGTLFDNDNTNINNKADDARFVLSFEGTSGFQSLLTDFYTDIRLLRLQRGPATPTIPLIIDASGSQMALFLGNSSGGGLRLNEGPGGTTEFDLGPNAMTFLEASAIAGSGRINPAYATIEFKNNAGTGVGSIYFAPGALLQDLTVDFAAAFTRDTIQLASDASVLGSLNLNKGVVLMFTNKNLIMEDGSGFTGGSSASYVDGQIVKNGVSDFVFPLGKAGKYAPLAIANLTDIDSYSARYFNSGYGSYSIDPTTLTNFPGYTVSRKEYWTLSQLSGNNAADVTLQYTNGATSNITDPSFVRIAHFNGATWTDFGQTAYGGNASAGFVTSAAVSSFSPFTFATTDFRILPLKLLSFTGKAQSLGSLLEWKASNTEIGSYFVLQRSSNAQQFTDITTVNTNGTFTDASFSYLDTRAIRGKNYYRLKLVNARGTIEYSNIVLVNFNTGAVITIQQNPVKDVLTVNLSALNSSGTARIVDMNGRTLATQSFKSSDYTLQMNTRSLASGSYMLQIIAGDNVISKQFVKAE